MRTINKYWLAGTLIALCWLFHGTAQVAKGKTLGHAISDNVVLQWNEIAVTTIGAQPPFPSTRYMATVQVAVFEAVNAISGKYEPYLGTIAAPDGASPEAAAITAAHGVLKAFFPATAPQRAPLSYTPTYLTEKILDARHRLKGNGSRSRSCSPTLKTPPS